MGVKVTKETGFFFIAGKYNETFTFTTAESVKAGSVFKNDAGNVIGLVVNDVTIDAEEQEARPVAVLTTGVVYADKLTATDDEKKALLASTGITFFGGSPFVTVGE